MSVTDSARPSDLPKIGDARRNRLLAALPAADYQRIAPHLELVTMRPSEVLYEPGEKVGYAYFPTTSVVSLLYVTVDGASPAIAVVGNEGVLGVALFLGGESTPSQAVVQSAGEGYRLKARPLKREFNLSGPMLRLFLRYTQSLITQMTQTAVCNCYHSVDQQLCRWVLLSLDRLGGNVLVMTHELIANMLGVRRETVTESVNRLEVLGLLNHRRGEITVLDRAGIEKRCCECYSVIKRETDRLLPPVEAR